MIRIIKAGRPIRPPKLDMRERRFGLAFLRAIRAAAEQTSEAELVRALEEQNAAKAVAAVRWDVVQDMLAESLPKLYQAVYGPAIEQARRAGKRVRKADLEVDYGFDYTDPGSVAWAKARAGALIQEWGGMSRDALQTLVARSFDEGIPPRQLAKLIREGGIGLLPRHETAVLRRLMQLRTEGRKPEQVLRMAERYSQQLLRLRAETIARTEIIEAHTKGLQTGWQEMIDEGLLPPDIEQEWITGGQDGRVCDLCLQLDGTKAKMGEPFGQDFDGQDVYGPPAHPQCRCSMSLAV